MLMAHGDFSLVSTICAHWAVRPWLSCCYAGSLSRALPCSPEDPGFRHSLLEGHWCLKLLLVLDLWLWLHLFFSSPSASASWRIGPWQDASKPSDLGANFFESMFADVIELSNRTDGFPFRTRTFDQLSMMQFDNGTGHVVFK